MKVYIKYRINVKRGIDYEVKMQKRNDNSSLDDIHNGV